MLSIGENGDFLDMLVALSACAIGYAKIGAEIINRLKNENLKDYPYKEWILTYGSENFHTVTRLEVAFWDHSLRMELNL